MAQGLARASQAAARTRWDGTLDAEMRRFLEAVRLNGPHATRGKLPAASPEQTKARQTCRRLGLAECPYREPEEGPQGWCITPFGVAALDRAV